MLHQRSKHIKIKCHFTREGQNEGLIDIKFISIDKNMADKLTKPLLKTKHLNCVRSLNFTHN